MREWLCLVFVLCLKAGLTNVNAQILYTSDGTPTGLEEEIRWRVNRGRFDSVSENHLRGTSYADIPASSGPLAPNQSITLAARHQSEDMAKHNVFQHATVTGSAYYDPVKQPNPWDRMLAEGYSWNTAGENIAAGYSGAEAAYVGWWNSSGHRANMYNSALREIGDGYYYWASSTYGRYYTMDLGSSGSSCFFTDTLFRDANSNGIYDQGEGVSNIVVKLMVGSTVQNYYDLSTGVGSFAVPITSIAAGANVQVVFSNSTSSSVTLSVPQDYSTYLTVTLASKETRLYGTFLRPSTARNIGLRELTTASAAIISSALAVAANGSRIALTWPSVSGQHYDVQWSTNLLTWAGLTNGLAGTGSNLSVSDATGAGTRKFYRLLIRQP